MQPSHGTMENLDNAEVVIKHNLEFCRACSLANMVCSLQPQSFHQQFAKVVDGIANGGASCKAHSLLAMAIVTATPSTRSRRSGRVPFDGPADDFLKMTHAIS